MRWLVPLLLWLTLALLQAAFGASVPTGGAVPSGYWNSGAQHSDSAQRMLDMLRHAADYGLGSRDYDVEGLTRQLATLRIESNPGDASWQGWDRRLTAATLQFVHDLHFGRVSPRAVGFDLSQQRVVLDTDQLLRQLARARQPQTVLEALEPAFVHYRLLKSALRRYQELGRIPGLTGLPDLDAGSVRIGARYKGAVQLRMLLRSTGDLAATAEPQTGDQFDAGLAQGLVHFQERHGLAEDGVLGRSSLEALRVPLSIRARQIELTLERWRWLPEFQSPPIIVNIPQFKLFVFRSMRDNAADILQIPVIVGQAFPAQRTPVFAGSLSYVVFRPYWDVPSSIMRKELLPRLRSRPAELDRGRFEIVRGEGDDAVHVGLSDTSLDALERGELRLRQLPGPDNSLGLVKFMLPNGYNVYLHDTPARELFARNRRAFSHGCIRVADTLVLATHVLGDGQAGWPAERIRAAMQGERTMRVNLPVKIPVMILYATVLATEDGRVYFFDDIYGHDRVLNARLNQLSRRMEAQ